MKTPDEWVAQWRASKYQALTPAFVEAIQIDALSQFDELSTDDKRLAPWREAMRNSSELWFRGYAARSDVTVEWLRENGQDVAPCNCDEPECMGWQCVDVASHAKQGKAMAPKGDR